MTLRKEAANKKKGTATIAVIVQADEDLLAAAKLKGNGLKRRTANAQVTAGQTKALKLRAETTGKLKRKLKRKGKATVKAEVTTTCTSTAGRTKTTVQTTKLKLKVKKS
ncbi:MAG: hypothetical protein R6X23_14755 [Acidimicrobiia bacterium]